MEETSQENVPMADGDDDGDSNADGSSSSADSSSVDNSSPDSNVDTQAGGAGSTLWEQMMAREGRDAARPSGMRAGDWQAERQLQEALRESRQVGTPDASAGGEANEESFIDAGFHALGTNAVEGEEEDEQLSNAIHNSESGGGSVGTSASAAAGGGGGEAGEEQNELDVEEDEDFGEVELVVTQDGGIIPVTSETGDAAGGAAVNKEKVASTSGSEHSARNARRGGVGGGVDGGAAGVEEGKGDGNEGEGEEKEEEEEEEGEEETPLPPDALLTLSDDVLHNTMLFLHPEDIFECRAVSSRWEFPLHEAVFEGLCRRTYLAQSAKKLLNVNRWRSWQRMYKFRPRLRDTGLYSLKTTYYKKPVRDMSTTWVPGTVLKVTYYRYFRFFGDGRVAYGLTHDSPKEFVRMIQEGSPKVVYGTYSISKWEVAVEIPTPWSTVNFRLQLANGERGRFTHLVVASHSSVPRNDPRAGRCHHHVKSSDVFMFRRVWQF
ncbi:unnamed protein product [Laminaria digitata]